MGCVAGKPDTQEDLLANERTRPLAPLPGGTDPGNRKPLRGSYDKEYSVIRSIGLETTGRRLLVTHKPTAMERCLKEMRKGEMEEDTRSYVARVDALIALDHPNVLKVFGVYEDLPAFYVATEAWDSDLVSYLVRTDAFTEKIAATIAQQVLGGLQFLHKKKLLHRCLLPDNVLVKRGNADRLRIALRDHSASGSLSESVFASQGSLPYSAPETFYMEYSEKSDVWSAGCFLYLIISGQYPFIGHDDFQTRLEVDTRSVTYQGGNWDKVTSMAKAFISKLLTRDVDRRPTSTEALNDPWLLNFGSLKEERMDMLSLRKIEMELRLAKAVACISATPVLTAGDQQKLLDFYTKKDSSRTGQLSIKELRQGLLQLTSSEEADQWLALLSPAVPADYLSFVTSCSTIRRRQACESLRSLLADLYPEGEASLQDFKGLLGKGVVGAEAPWKKFLSKAGEGLMDVKELADRVMQVYL